MSMIFDCVRKKTPIISSLPSHIPSCRGELTFHREVASKFPPNNFISEVYCHFTPEDNNRKSLLDADQERISETLGKELREGHSQHLNLYDMVVPTTQGDESVDIFGDRSVQEAHS